MFIPEFNEATQAHVDSFDQELVAKATKLNIHYWNFGSSEELEQGIERFLTFNPTEAKLLGEEGEPNEQATV